MDTVTPRSSPLARRNVRTGWPAPAPDIYERSLSAKEQEEGVDRKRARFSAPVAARPGEVASAASSPGPRHQAGQRRDAVWEAPPQTEADARPPQSPPAPWPVPGLHEAAQVEGEGGGAGTPCEEGGQSSDCASAQACRQVGAGAHLLRQRVHGGEGGGGGT